MRIATLSQLDHRTWLADHLHQPGEPALPGEPTPIMEPMHCFARRAAGLLAAAPASEPADMISFGSGDAFPDILPDMVDAATLMLLRSR